MPPDRRRRRWLDPGLWAGGLPNGLGQVKPNHYLDILKTGWENRHNLPYAWRILTRGVCDGCALGTSGLHDPTIKGPHLCTVRLSLLKLNTMPALDPDLLADVSTLAGRSSKELRQLGRLPYPFVRQAGEAGFRRVSWDEALALLGVRLRAVEPSRLAFYLTSRGLTNETYYAAQKAARFLGTNHLDNASRVCHAPSTTALKRQLGVGASTCSYVDWLETDLIVFFGSDAPSNQPVTTKYLYHAKRNGAKVAVVNPYREPGLERYWVPSIAESALFGTKLTDRFFPIDVGGDIAFCYGVLKHLLATGAVDHEFIAAHTSGWPELAQRVEALPWDELEQASGSDQGALGDFAAMLAAASRAVFVWSMGITQHRFGVDNVGAIINLALARGFLGRDGCGLMPIRGHSGVQGSAEVGAVPNSFPGGVPITPQTAAERSARWGFAVPDQPGYTAPEMIDAAGEGQLEALYAVGGNFLETLPDPARVRAALLNVPVKIHQDIFLTAQMLLDPTELTILLPARTRYEQEGGGTETSTERRIFYSPEIAGPRIGEAHSEWRILTDVAVAVHPERAALIQFADARAIRDEIAVEVPFYQGIETLGPGVPYLQWGGRLLGRNGVSGLPDGRSRFASPPLPSRELANGCLRLSCRRGKQFNSMVEADRDPLTGLRRNDLLVSADDASRLGIGEGQRVRVISDHGVLEATCRLGPVHPGNVQAHWPEANRLIDGTVRDPAAGIPDYHVTVRLEPLP